MNPRNLPLPCFASQEPQNLAVFVVEELLRMTRPECLLQGDTTPGHCRLAREVQL